MKKFFWLGILLITMGCCLLYDKEIATFILSFFPQFQQVSSTLENNSYADDVNYNFVQLVSDFNPKNTQDIINIYYTVLNSGMSEFTFYCHQEYTSCIDDVNYLSNNQVLLSNINNFVPVYNSFDNIETEFDSLGKVTISIQNNYQDNEITAINQKVQEIIQDTITDDMTNEDKIKVIHDYIINHTKYDINRSDNKDTTFHSDTAYGTLLEGYAICGGYADSMKLFLDQFGIPNYKISSENHIWNLVYLNDDWYHLDLTWDDPVTSNGKDVLEYDYFLITTDELKELETDQHVFDIDVYQEAI